jgi:hypothetical protein
MKIDWGTNGPKNGVKNVALHKKMWKVELMIILVFFWELISRSS